MSIIKSTNTGFYGDNINKYNNILKKLFIDNGCSHNSLVKSMDRCWNNEELLWMYHNQITYRGETNRILAAPMCSLLIIRGLKKI